MARYVMYMGGRPVFWMIRSSIRHVNVRTSSDLRDKRLDISC